MSSLKFSVGQITAGSGDGTKSSKLDERQQLGASHDMLAGSQH